MPVFCQEQREKTAYRRSRLRNGRDGKSLAAHPRRQKRR
jgi:hypothetical protein